MAIAQELANSTRALEKAIKQHKTAKLKPAGFGVIGWIGVARDALKAFCKHWPDVKQQLEKAAAFLKGHGQGQLAGIIVVIVKFLDTFAKVCPLIP